jgi:hypothetical protein
MTKIFVSVVVLVVIVGAVKAAPAFNFVETSNSIDITIDGSPFTSYLFGDELSKPCFAPVRSPSGIVMTRRFPLTEIPGGSDEHIHHTGLFFAVDYVNGVQFWNNQGVSYRIKHLESRTESRLDGSGSMLTRSQWIDESDLALLEEKREMTFIAGKHEGEYAIDFSIDLTALVDQVEFEDTEEGMFAIRYNDWLREPEDGEGVQAGQPLPEESIAGTGRYFSSNGDETADGVWGKRASWVAIQGIRDGKVVGVAILNHPESLNYPTYWHARDYGLFTANPLGQGDFQRQDDFEKNDPLYLRLTLRKGESSHFRFKVIVFEGIRTQEQVEMRFKEFVQ